MHPKLKKALASVARWPGVSYFSGGVPSRVYPETKVWVESVKASSPGVDATWTPLREPDITEQPSPIRINPDDRDYYHWNRPWENYGTFVLEARNLHYESITDSVLTPDRAILYDLSRQWPDKPNEHALLSAIRMPRPVELKGRTLVLSVRGGGKNYHDWMTALVPRLKIALDADYKVDDFDYILVNRLDDGFRTETLEKMGIPLEKVMQSDRERIWKLESVVIPSLPYQDGFSRRWAMEYVNALVGDTGRNEGERVYISRSDARLRKILNEDELITGLSSLGFKVVSFTGMTVSDQASIMRRARLIVAPHGAGLTNILFSPDHVDVVELHARDYYCSSFWWISSRKGNRHAVLCSQSDKNNRPLPNQGIQVDVDRLINYLKSVINKPITAATIP